MKTCDLHNTTNVVRIRPRKGGGTYRESRCLKCQSIKASQWYNQNKDTFKYKAVKRTYEQKNKRALKSLQLQAKYNITIEQFESILANQLECCAICKKHQSKFKKALHVDHDHKTGKVRGLLCNSCNRGLGVFKDNAEYLISASTYIKESNQ